MKNNRKMSQIVNNRTLVTFLCLFFLAGTVAADAASSVRSASANLSAKTIAPASRSLPLLVDVGAEQCIPCKMMAPILEELKKEYAGVLQVKFVDTWKYPEEARTYRIMGIPTQIFYDASGRELGRHMGFISKESIVRRFEQLGVSLKTPRGK